MTVGLDKCEFCGSPAHVWFNCTKKPDGWKPERLTRAKPNLPDAGIRHDRPADAAIASRVGAGRGPNRIDGARDVLATAESAAATKRPRGRPKTIADMKAYKAQKERERRAKAKA